MVPEAFRGEIAQWVKQGDHELIMAKKNFEIAGYDTTVLLCQQATEKFLKAFYIHNFLKRPPKTHHLDDLADTLGLPETLKEKAQILSGDYTASRYPDILGMAPVDAYGEKEAADRLAKAGDIIDWCRSQ